MSTDSSITPSDDGWRRGGGRGRLQQSARPTRTSQSLGEIEHSCFLERSQQQEATPSFAYYSMCMLLRRCACWRRPLGFPYRT
jgi:hypothetical protein